MSISKGIIKWKESGHTFKYSKEPEVTGWRGSLNGVSVCWFTTTARDSRDEDAEEYSYLKFILSGGREFKYLTLEEAKAKAEELLIEWLDKAGLYVKPFKCDNCGDKGREE